MLGAAQGEVHIVLRKQFQRFLYIRRLVQQQPQAGDNGHVGLIGILVNALLVAYHEIGHAQALFVHAVQDSVNGRQRHELIAHAPVGLPALPKAQEVQIAGGDSLIAILGNGMYQYFVTFLPVEVPAKEGRTVGTCHCDGGAAIVSDGGGGVRLPKAVGEIGGDVVSHLGIAFCTALLQKAIEAIVALVFHTPQMIIKLLNGHGRRELGAEHGPRPRKGCNQHSRNNQKRSFRLSMPHRGRRVRFVRYTKLFFRNDHFHILLPCPSEHAYHLVPAYIVNHCRIK